MKNFWQKTMKKNKNKYPPNNIFIATLIIAIMGSHSLYGAVVDGTVAVVNNEVITESELNDALNPIYEQLKATSPRDELEIHFEDARKEILQQLIEDKLILQEAKRQKVFVSSDEIKTKLSELKAKFPSEEEFEKSLRTSFMTLKNLKDRIKDQLMMARLFDKEIRWGLLVNPQEITDYYKSNADKFLEPEKVKVMNIMVKFKDSTERLAAHRKIREALSLLKQGRDFKEVAIQYSQGPNASDGGDLGFIKKGQMLDEIDKVLFKTKKDELTDIIETESAFHIFLVTDKSEKQESNIDEVKQVIHDILFQKKLKERFNEWISKLKKDAYISIK
ncbi:MAG: peptidylprolyl isomerase [Candidatus Omnitrophota bacterium]